MHRYDDEGRTDGLKRLVAGQRIPRWQVWKGDKGGLVSGSTFIGADAWVDAESIVRDSYISGKTLVKSSEISASWIEGSTIESSAIYQSFLQESSCERAKISYSTLHQSSVAVHRSLSVNRWKKRNSPETATAELMVEAMGLQRLHKVEDTEITYSMLSFTVLSGGSSVTASYTGSSEIHSSVISESSISNSRVQYTKVSSSFVETSYLHDRVVRKAGVFRLLMDNDFQQLRFPSKHTFERSSKLSGGYFGDFPAQIDIWPKLAGRIRQIAVVGWTVGVPWAFWTTPLLSAIITAPLLALIGLRLAGGLASRIAGKLEARSTAKDKRRGSQSRAGSALKQCSSALSSLKQLLNGLLLAGTVLVPTAIVSGAVVERVLNSDGEPSRSTEAVDSVRFETGSDTDQFDRGASSSTASSEVSVPTPLPVTSANLRAVAYDREHSYLYVWFHSGDLYRYENVSESVYRSLLVASSKGRYHASYIRDQYTSVRIG